jgi:hypothetical protein
MRCKLLLIMLFSIALTGFVCAEFVFSDTGSSITKQYSSSNYIKAKINISFQNESLSSSFVDSIGNSITLSLLLTKVPNFGYTINSTLNTINSGFSVITFDNANFINPATAGNINYQLNFSGRELFNTQISIISTNNSVTNAINEKQETLNKVKLEIKNFDYSVQKILNEELNITDIENELNATKIRYEQASPDEYGAILQNISEINIPKSVNEIVKTTPLTFYPREEDINLDILALIAGEGNYTEDKNDEYLNALISWYPSNLQTKLTFKRILIAYEEGSTVNLGIFDFQFDKSQLKNNAYFIIEDLGDITFSGVYSEQKLNEYIYINLEGISGIIFSTKQNVDFMNVPAFIAPSLEDLVIPAPPTPWIPPYILVVLVVFVVLLIGVVVYIGMQMWYRRKYENTLFKNRNNLYNIMTYIQHSKRKGMTRENIRTNLVKAKWRREQINYALNKYEGKKIAGIIQRPFKKVLAEIERNAVKYPKK